MNRIIHLSLAVGILTGSIACTRQDEPSRDVSIEENPQIAQVQSSPTPLPSPTPMQPTPAPLGPDFMTIRSNREVMDATAVVKYGRNLSGKTVGGWIGRIAAIKSTESGHHRVIVDMDIPEKEFPLNDIVLDNIPSSIAEKLSVDSTINFSGTIQGFIDVEPEKNLLLLDQVSIYPFDSD